MRQQDALNVLGLSGQEFSAADIKKAFRKAAQQYHPDRNPAGADMMTMVNAAYNALKTCDHITRTDAQQDYGSDINQALNAVIHLGLHIEVCGAWVWLTGDTKPHRETLKKAGFLWAPKKAAWYYRPTQFKSHNRGHYSLEDIRDKYGSQTVNAPRRPQLT